MGSISEEEDDQFFDSKGYITPLSESGSDEVEFSDSESRVVVEDVIRSFGYEFWIQSPGAIRERRPKLLKLMGLASNRGTTGEELGEEGCSQLDSCSRVMAQSGAVLRSSFRDLQQQQGSSHSFTSCCSSDYDEELLDGELAGSLVRRIRNLDDGTVFIVDELGQDGFLRRLREVGSNRTVSGEEFERIIGISPLVQRVMRKEDVAQFGQASQIQPFNKQRVKKGWLQRLGIGACLADVNDSEDAIGAHDIRVRTYKKRSKEFSALYTRQDMIGHKGAILAMKFSLDGELLASGGEDGVVRVWQVIESETSDLARTSHVDPCNVYFTINRLGELVPINVDKEKRAKMKTSKKSFESACVIFPQKVFQLGEKPLHEFTGHQGDILDLSWSHNKCLLSSSDDKTVRLWRVGSDECLKVFSHNDFVTCIHFNPADEDYFISGSVDGKVRIWAISAREVVDWTDVKEIVTAVCYRPDGKGAIVGSINGDCYFYDTSENRLQMRDQISFHGKKKTPFRRIAGFQFSPGDPSQLMVTIADSEVRILKGIDVICRYKGVRNTASHICASFTSDGKHVVSASDDSCVYIWDRDDADRPHSRANSSCERFLSTNVSLAVPWCGTTLANVVPTLSSSSGAAISPSGITVKYPAENRAHEHHHHHRSPLFSSDGISLGFVSDPFSRAVPTWPEEKLTGPNSNPNPNLNSNSNSIIVSPTTGKSEYRFLKTTCQNMAGGPHAWGMVIVTAGWDGRIRVFQNYGLPVRL